MITALLPPNSKIERPKRLATFVPTIRPTLVEPVADTNGTRPSSHIFSPIEPGLTNKQETPSGILFSAATSFQIL